MSLNNLEENLILFIFHELLDDLSSEIIFYMHKNFKLGIFSVFDLHSCNSSINNHFFDWLPKFLLQF